jgi:methylmalonyl-CoA/ethylmalonyl-CoA epimerase
MPKKLEHIGIAVSNLEASEKLFTKLLGVAPYKRELVESEMVMTSFFLLGDIKFELLAATSPESTIAKFIEKKGEGLHHLAFESDNIIDELAEKEKQNFQLIHQTPKDGADNKTIAFIHPKSTGGVLTELCQEKTNH